MSKLYKKLTVIFLMSFLMAGCGSEEPAETTTTQADIISVGDYDTTAPTTFTKITSLKYSFDVRDRDLNGEFVINPLSILNTKQSPKYINSSDYSYNNVFPTKNNTIINTEDEYLLYKPSECIYSARVNIVNGNSLFYYTPEIAEAEMKKYLKRYGVTSVSLDASSLVLKANDTQSRVDYFEKVEFKDNDVLFTGFIYGIETDDGQSFFLVAGNKNHIELEDLTKIANSIENNSEPTETTKDEGKTDIEIDWQGVLLKGSFANSLGINANIDNSYLLAATDNLSDKEPYFANPYSDCILKFNIYTVPEGISVPEFLQIYPEEFAYVEGEPIWDKSEGAWYCLDKEYEGLQYNKSSLIMSIQGTYCVVFQLWYNDDAIRKDLIDSVATITRDIGTSSPVEMPESMREKYKELHPEPVKTVTDESIGINLDSTEEASTEEEKK